MDWNTAASVAEIIGAVAVVVSIVYLARQVGHANRTAEAATSLEASKLLTEWHGRINATPELAYIFIQGVSDTTEFSDEERARFLTATAELFLLIEGLYQQRKLGFFNEEAWKPIERFLIRIAQSPTVKPWWDSEVALNGEEFRAYVNSICADNPQEARYAGKLHTTVFE